MKKPESIVKGTWSPVYSQSLLVELEDGQRFFTNFRYDLKGGIPRDRTKLRSITPSNLEKFDSVCGQTMVGIVQARPTNALGETPDHINNFTATCFYAKQLQRYDIETTREEHIGGNQKASTIIKH